MPDREARVTAAWPSPKGPGPSRAGADQDAGPVRDPEDQARQLCLRLLTGRPRTRAQLAAAMQRHGVPGDAAEAVLALLSRAP